MASPKESEIKEEDDPFADIMKKLKSQQAPKSPVNELVIKSPPAKKSEFFNLMDEEPPETFKQFNEPSEVIHKSSIKTKQPEPSSFIKAAFSSKPKESVKVFEKDTELLNEESRGEEKVTNIGDEPIKFNHDSEDKDTVLPKQDYNVNIVKEFEKITEDAEPKDIKEKEFLILKDTKDYKVEYEEVKEDFVCESIVNDHSELKFSDKVNVEPVPVFNNDDIGVEPVFNNNDIVKEELDSIESTPRFMSQMPSTPIYHQSAFAFPTTFEERTVYESKPIINFDGSVSSGPTHSIEQVSSTSTIPFFDSLSSIISNNSDSSSVSSPTSSTSPKTTGFRASIIKHGLSALEKIGKSTADVVVSTRNKLSEPSMSQFTSSHSQQTITPDFNDENSSFYDILKLYGGYSKLQVKEDKKDLFNYLSLIYF